MEKKVVFKLDSEKIRKLKILAANETTTMKVLFDKAVDLLLSKENSKK